jgi:NarL family two-component system response regulator LiaR
MEESDARSPGRPLRAIIADDDAFVRRVIRDALEKAGVTVIAEARNGRQAVELVVYYRPDVVLMDVVMPDLDGILATRRIMKELPEQLVIVLTGTEDENDELGLQAIQAGAAGFLSKDVDIDILPRALDAVWAGEAAISRKMTKTLLERFRRERNGSAGMRPVKSPLTAREWEVMDLLAAGMSTEDLADHLVLSPETVRSHIKNILRKLGVRSREDALAAVDRMRKLAPDGPE